MFEPLFDKEERGQVGIGTLIVFIAMVLVAAIAAGVLINTAGFLQTQAEATGEESTAQVTDGVQVYTAAASASNIDTSSGGIQQIDLQVGLSPGSNRLDLQQVEIQVVGPEGVATADMAGSSKTLTSPSSRAEVSLQLNSGASGRDVTAAVSNGLGAGEEIEVTITSPSGGQTFEVFTAPSPLIDTESVTL
jgi:flagellin FlaB